MLGYVFQLSTSDTRKATCQLRCLHRTDHHTSSRTHVLNTGVIKASHLTMVGVCV